LARLLSKLGSTLGVVVCSFDLSVFAETTGLLGAWDARDYLGEVLRLFFRPFAKSLVQEGHA
jgi:hypothetical protein